PCGQGQKLRYQGAEPPLAEREVYLMSVFDDLRALLTPARLLHDPQATGAGGRAPVLASGADRSLLASRHPNMKPLEGGVFVADQPRPPPYLGEQGSPNK